MANATQFIGCKISLISKSEIRYEGILYSLDVVEATISLAKVKSFGTEDRPTERMVPPKDEIYEFIIFRGSDIKGIDVVEPPKPTPPLVNDGLPNDPAIVEVSHYHTSSRSQSHSSSIGPVPVQVQVAPGYGGIGPNSYGTSPFCNTSVAAASSSSVLPKPPVVSQQPQSLQPTRTAVASNISSATVSESPEPNVVAAARSETNDDVKFKDPSVGSQSSNSVSTTTIRKHEEGQTRLSYGRGGSNRGRGHGFYRGSGDERYRGGGGHRGGEGGYGHGGGRGRHQHGSQNYSASHHESANGGGGRGRAHGSNDYASNEGHDSSPQRRQSQGYQPRGRGGTTNYNNPSHGGYRGSRGGGGGGFRNNRMQGILRAPQSAKVTFDNDFDFEKANEELQTAIKNLKLTEKANAGLEMNSIAGNQVAHGSKDTEEQENKEPAPCYKKDDFFDSISCEALERGKGSSNRPDWKAERKLNAETFGFSPRGGGVGGGGYNRGGGGRGYYNNRGGGGYGGGRGNSRGGGYSNYSNRYNNGRRGRGGASDSSVQGTAHGSGSF